MLQTKPFADAVKVVEQIENSGYEAFFVGGCVRDFLLDRELGDIDIATSARPEVIQQIFKRVIPVGIQHGTVIVQSAGGSYEVTTYRVDGDYTDQRHPDSVHFIQTIDGDLERRDFTINALAMDRYGEIIDLFDGRKDIERKVIRTVGNGYDRFMEDPLRIIRALRFSSQLGFTISENTLRAIKYVKKEIENIAVERIGNELAKLFAGEHSETGIKYLRETKVYEHLPVMIEYPYIINKLPSDLQPLKSFGAVIALFHLLESAISIKQWVSEWKLSNKIKQEAIQLYEGLMHYEERGLDFWTVYCLPKHLYEDFTRLVNCLFSPDSNLAADDLIEINEKLPIESSRGLEVSGHDIREIFPEAEKGPWIRETLIAVEKQVVAGKLENNKKVLRDWIKWNPHATD
ncbi:CCA tRNA nucleotidyltransferase [Virgibacillus kekensis]|uniref:CCA-adding enzyme n=1 Tax=Virgibacillus kekensis TaxID=202261 RepID=A0ABV9DEY0_9BACI